jgi:peptidoglycan/LPS O-acetylase OafA/YrhL
MRSIPFAVLTILNGALWLALSLVAFGDPTYWSPSSPLDFAAVGLFSAAALTLGLCLWRFDDGRLSATSIAARIGAISAIVVSAANFAEDWLRISPFGVLWVAGVFVGTGAMLVLGIALAWTPRRRALAVPVLVTILGFFLGSTPYGRLLIGIAWIVTGALNLARVRPFRGEEVGVGLR